MARTKTYKNNGGKAAISFADGRPIITVGPGGSYTTSDEDEQHALKLSGFSETREPKPEKTKEESKK